MDKCVKLDILKFGETSRVACFQKPKKLAHDWPEHSLAVVHLAEDPARLSYLFGSFRMSQNQSQQ